MTGCGFVVGCLGFLSSSKHSACRPLGLPAPVFRSPGHCPFRNPLAWLWGEKRKPCVKQSQNGSVLDLFAAVNGRRKSFRRKLHRSKNWTEWNNFVKNYETELHSSEPDVIQDSARSTIWLNSPTRIDFCLSIALKVQLYLFSSCFLF